MTNQTNSDSWLRNAAQRDWCGQDLEIDNNAEVVRADGGCWVAARVWLQYDTPDEERAEKRVERVGRVNW